MEAKKKVAFLGPRGTYTQQATIQRFPESQYDIIPQTTIEDVFAAVQGGTTSYGIVPFENSSNGYVEATLSLFADAKGLYPDIRNCGEIELPVHHCLVGHTPKDASNRSEMNDASETVQPGKPKAVPICDLKHINKLYSHPQAWGQCKIFLSRHLKGVERQDVSSTSKAAELVAQDTSGTSAAISAKLAASLNDLSILAEDIEDKEGNTTRFFVLRRAQDTETSGGESHINDSMDGTEKEQYKSLISFTVSHFGEPGALADSLAVFKKFRLNLTSIFSLPSGEAPWHYIFFVEFMGKKSPDGQGGAVNDALEQLDKVARSWRWLGSWEKPIR